MYVPAGFQSFLQAGFECSTHRLRNGCRLDLVAATAHDILIKEDYSRLLKFGILTVREGLRWHLVEASRGKYDFSSVLPMLDAAKEFGIQQIIDLFHFGWPEYLDIFAPEFVEAFGNFALAFAKLLRERALEAPLIAPMNEISFLSWAGGDAAYLNPFERGRGPELKTQLVRAALRAAEAFKSELPRTRLVWPEPVIHIAGDPGKPGDQDAAEAYRLSMFEAWDMLSGRRQPELGGSEEVLQVIGVNFYDRNEWINHGATLAPSDPLYRPFNEILDEVWNRYHVPMFVAETGTEDSKRPEWFAYISEEVRHATRKGVPVSGVCLYPILNHPGWDDGRHCHNGLFDYADTRGERQVYEPLAEEIRRQHKLNSVIYTN